MTSLIFSFDDGSEAIAHYGVKGMKWGVRRYTKDDKIFVSGSSKTQDKDSGFYRKKLPRPIRRELKRAMRAKSTILVGDAPGIDRQVQDYLKSKNYMNVNVYGPGNKVRYKAAKDWVEKLFNDPNHEPGSKEWLAKKDEAMTRDSTRSLAVTITDGSSATRRNVERSKAQNKPVSVYNLDYKRRRDGWVY